MSEQKEEGKKYELVIIGGGPAGLTAAIYSSRARIKTLLIEKAITGGQITYADIIENFPGFPDGISGLDLSELLLKQANKFGLDVLETEITGIRIEKGQKIVSTPESDLAAGAVIIAGGSERQKLNVPGESTFLGKGVSYCATCDGALFPDANIAVIGGGNAALTEAIFLTNFASAVTVIHRREELRAMKILQEKASQNSKIKLMLCTRVEEILGNKKVEKLKLVNLNTNEKFELPVQAVFVNIGLKPSTGYLKGLVELSADGSIIVNQIMETSVPGLFAAGDIRNNSIKQAIAAAGDGAVAAVSAERYLRKLHH